MNPRSLLLSILLVVGLSVVRVVEANKKHEQKALCADANGIFLGLAADLEAYSTTLGAPGDQEKDEVAQDWVLTAEDTVDPHSGKEPSGPQHSFEGKFLQVLPDSGRSYPGRGQHLKHAMDLDKKGFKSPSVSFWLNVAKGAEGIHTLFLRWTGGDTVGGGDSLYVVLYKKMRNNQFSLIHGQQTVKPTVIPIETGMGRFAGCCYDMVTHDCPCYREVPGNATCPAERWISTERAATFGVQCKVGGGAYTIIHAPEWYLYAGQEAGDVMDFDSEPWDVTCEADGSNTRDSGHDFPSWELDGGIYELRIYAREDGTALDAIYVAGPTGKAPAVSQRYSAGDSTICPHQPVAGKIVGYSFLGFAVVFLAWFTSTSRGKAIMGTVLTNPRNAVRYVYVEGV